MCIVCHMISYWYIKQLLILLVHISDGSRLSRLMLDHYGISKSMCSNACALALREFCEEATIVMFEPSDMEILIWIGEIPTATSFSPVVQNISYIHEDSLRRNEFGCS
ncbi:uncharacterized protein LOC135150818 [Daucus carota subsp. sativus]|uniref:uncharacterized protein LOC135150818 n=1 Tax=Daucus carota subsp. sativus TaxID=79200 RepID=UPI003083C668